MRNFWEDYSPLIIWFVLIVAMLTGLVVWYGHVQYNFAVECVQNGGSAIDGNCIMDGVVTSA